MNRGPLVPGVGAQPTDLLGNISTKEYLINIHVKTKNMLYGLRENFTLYFIEILSKPSST